MAAGDLVTANEHYEFNGLLFGSNTSFITTKVDGLIGMPSTDSNDIDKLLEHGSIPGLLRIQKRTVAIDLSILGIPFGSIETNLTLAASAFQTPALRNSRVLAPFVFKRPGQVKKQIFARCDRRDFSSTYEVAHGHAVGSVQLVAPDPVIYSWAQNSAANSSMVSGAHCQQ